jgi:UDP-N-acetylglucosamine 2-epimerase (non-hydrolysing)
VNDKKYLLCIGTRPEIIKMAPVYHALMAQGKKVQVLHTGQHGAVAAELYRFFGMPPNLTLDLKRLSNSLASLTSVLFQTLENAVLQLKPDIVLVQGDTTSAFVGATVAYYHQKPVAHVEAGLRTRQNDPFPEEKNRELIGRIASWHFPPTTRAVQNLREEGVDPNSIFEVGNTVIDAAKWALARVVTDRRELEDALPTGLSEFLENPVCARTFLVTAHRRENWGQPIRDIAAAVAKIVEQFPDVGAIWPVHPNPAVRDDVETVLLTLTRSVRERIFLTEPLSYPALIYLLHRSAFTLTDSGGIQEEASAFAKPVLVARESTERQELVDAGGALLVGTDVGKIINGARKLLSDPLLYKSMQIERSPFGDGLAGSRIASILARHDES